MQNFIKIFSDISKISRYATDDFAALCMPAITTSEPYLLNVHLFAILHYEINRSTAKQTSNEKMQPRARDETSVRIIYLARRQWAIDRRDHFVSLWAKCQCVFLRRKRPHINFIVIKYKHNLQLRGTVWLKQEIWRIHSLGVWSIRGYYVDFLGNKIPVCWSLIVSCIVFVAFPSRMTCRRLRKMRLEIKAEAC